MPLQGKYALVTGSSRGIGRGIALKLGERGVNVAVQPYSRVHVSRIFRKASRTAGLRDFHFHDLRHHGATMALNKGFTAPIVQASVAGRPSG